MITYKINYNSKDKEYVVKLYDNGKHIKEADYYTDDGLDAQETARAMLAQQTKNFDQVIATASLASTLQGTIDAFERIYPYKCSMFRLVDGKVKVQLKKVGN